MIDYQDIIRLKSRVSDTIVGNCELPTSKSESNRLLIAAALCKKPVQVNNISDSEDVQTVVRAFETIGFVERLSNKSIIINTQLIDNQNVIHSINIGAAGTAFRFLLAALSVLPLTCILDGNERLRLRPIYPLYQALKQLGADVTSVHDDEIPPYRIVGNPNLQPIHLQVDASQSSQFLSALLLLGPHLKIGTKIEAIGNVVSRPYTELTLATLRQLGVVYITDNQVFILKEKQEPPNSVFVSADWSAASYLFALAIHGPTDITLKGLDLNSLQGDRQQLSYWQQLGLVLDWTVGGLRVQHSGDATRKLPAFAFDFEAMPDLAQTFAFLAPFADGPCLLTGLQTLPLKETDRIVALTTELERLGCKVVQESNSLKIWPLDTFPLGTIAFNTYDDHRMAMSIAPLVRRLGAVAILSPGVVAKSFPNFFEVLSKLNIENY